MSKSPSPGPFGIAWEVHCWRAVWIAWSMTMLGSALPYAWKAADHRSAFLRWRHQVLELGQGVNIWDRYYFPNPPILPLTLYPLFLLPTMLGAMLWYGLKVGMATGSFQALHTMARGQGKSLPSWGIALVLILSLRPILSDLQHGNVNLLILSLIVGALMAWRSGRDGLAGLLLALSIAYKVTPALFLPYFVYKRNWRLVGASLVGLVLFLFVIPGAVLGPRFNWECLMEWRLNMISPYVEGEVIPSVQEVNQSMAGVATRVLTDANTEGQHGNSHILQEHDHLNLLSWAPETVARLVKLVSLGFVGLLALFCRTKAARRDDPRWLGEFALVVLTMLFVSERSWKHHFVTLLIPNTFLVYQLCLVPMSRRCRTIIGVGLLTSAALMATTSSEIGGVLLGEDGHEVALFYGMFFWSALVLYGLTAWRVLVGLRAPEDFGLTPSDARAGLRHELPQPHYGGITASRPQP